MPSALLRTRFMRTAMSRLCGSWSTACGPAIDHEPPRLGRGFISTPLRPISEDMELKRPMPTIVERLRRAGLRPTRQRVALARLLFDSGDRHVTAEQLHGEALAASIRVSLATVYNTLHHFTSAGLMRE